MTSFFSFSLSFSLPLPTPPPPLSLSFFLFSSVFFLTPDACQGVCMRHYPSVTTIVTPRVTASSTKERTSFSIADPTYFSSGLHGYIYLRIFYTFNSLHVCPRFLNTYFQLPGKSLPWKKITIIIIKQNR